ncbi:hypothetical protein, partial [Sporolactobacillus sp. KGMB 08714]
ELIEGWAPSQLRLAFVQFSRNIPKSNLISLPLLSNYVNIFFYQNHSQSVAFASTTRDFKKTTNILTCINMHVNKPHL